MEREHGWRHCCNCNLAVNTVQSKTRNAGVLRREAITCQACNGLGSTVYQMPFEAIQDGRLRNQQRFGTTFSDLNRSSPGGFTRSSSTPLDTLRQIAAREPWLSELKEPVFHANTGRKCFIDKSTMRMEWLPNPLETRDKWSMSRNMLHSMTASSLEQPRAMTAPSPSHGRSGTSFLPSR